MKKPTLIAIDLESVLFPEIWEVVGEKTGIDELLITSRDIPDFEELMKKRIEALKKHNITYNDILSIIETIEPMEGAYDFLEWARKQYPLVIISDTFYEFIKPIVVRKLGYPTVLSNSLEINENGKITDFRIREPRGKKVAVEAFQSIGFNVIAMGDSFNDIKMLQTADAGAFLHASDTLKAEFPDIPSFNNYEDLKIFIENNAN
ncbi:bifunctional phosphoserine phosphatase/homoserine phosphotransferase ThrH [Candidatus Wolfebacteria bacterium]|nr:MAG: bifunctional phosphoserine phosphatase/homoserine phosphotransferase ThrH [Candidatus Wolfebacteria bacterium]